MEHTPRFLLRCLLLAALLSGTAGAADFGFSVIIRAGLNGNGDWELGIGPVGNNTVSTAQVTPYFSNGTARRFEVGYTQATNTAFVRLYRNATNYDQATYQPAGGGPLNANGTWTLPANSFFVSASNRPAATSVAASGMALSSGLNVLQGLSNTSLTASQPGGSAAFASLTGPVIFQAQGAGGSWMLSGTITFNGLGGANGASRSKLQFDLTANASDTPEPSTALFFAMGLGLCAFRICRIRRVQSPEAGSTKKPGKF